MSFFTEEQLQTGDEFSLGELLEPMPEGTKVLAIAEQANVAEYNEEQYINIQWRVSKPEMYTGRVVFQKIKVWSHDEKTKDKARRMLMAINNITGGGLLKAMERYKESEPSDVSLAAITNIPAVLSLAVWDLDGKTGNWVRAVSAYKRETAAPAPAIPPQPQPPADDDLPF